MQLPDAAIGSIVAAAIAGLVVFISTVLSKEQKTSEFRQVWIDEIRKDVAAYISGTTEVVALHFAKRVSPKDQEEFIEKHFTLMHELQSTENRIILRLNVNEHAELIEKITEFRMKMIAAYNGDDTRNDEIKLTKDLIDSTKIILKCEWNRVKMGEPSFRIVKAIALFSIVGFSAFSICYYLVPFVSKISVDFNSNGKPKSIENLANETSHPPRSTDNEINVVTRNSGSTSMNIELPTGNRGDDQTLNEKSDPAKK
ncbi:hypothetical protein [Pandoraea sputorum]|uniref:hypothetical protein n=1 Tax=Pandoraea sputorum TaxID=93222 RepID=UPI002B30353A|nr:hypothetical protein THI4931_47060 [Pandoraea sputorum]